MAYVAIPKDTTSRFPSKKHSSHGRKIIRDAEAYSPATAASWTGMGVSAPTTQDGALDSLAAVVVATPNILSVTGTITSAQLLAISTPVSLIPAQGAGTVVVVDEIELLHTYSTAAYATGADLQIEYATSGDNIALVAAAFVTGTANQNMIAVSSAYANTGAAAAVAFNVTANANKAVQVTGSNFTNGNAANILKYKIKYHVVTLLT